MKLLLLIFLPMFIFSQKNENTRAYFPLVNGKYLELNQTVKVYDVDTTEISYHKYEHIVEGKRMFIVSTTYDSDNLIVSSLKERITRRGLRFEIGKFYVYSDSNIVNEYLVNGKKAITFPFKDLSKMKNWKTKTRNTYANKVIVKSIVAFIGIKRVTTDGVEERILIFKRTVKKRFKNEYDKLKEEYEYTWEFAPGKGMVKYEMKGSSPYKGVVILNKFR